MDQSTLEAQAQEITALVPKVMRRLFTLDVNDPTIDLPVAQMRVCSMLTCGPRTMSMLSRDLGISLSAVTQIADRLERAQLVERLHDEDDRRVKSLQLTPYAVEIMQARRDRRTRRVQQIIEQLQENTRTEIITALQCLLRAGQSLAPTDFTPF
jgi:DNA-binding MarR family transcriptional regulator